LVSAKTAVTGIKLGVGDGVLLPPGVALGVGVCGAALIEGATSKARSMARQAATIDREVFNLPLRILKS
jgi:hypothetical protein